MLLSTGIESVTKEGTAGTGFGTELMAWAGVIEPSTGVIGTACTTMWSGCTNVADGMPLEEAVTSSCTTMF